MQVEVKQSHASGGGVDHMDTSSPSSDSPVDGGDGGGGDSAEFDDFTAMPKSPVVDAAHLGEYDNEEEEEHRRLFYGHGKYGEEGSDEDDGHEYIDPVDAEMVVNEDSDDLQHNQTANWSAYFSGAGVNDDDDDDDDDSNGKHMTWNMNDMFKFGFQVNSPSEDDGEISLLDDDARKLLLSDDHAGELYGSRVRTLVQRFLGLETPRLTDQILEFLLAEDNLDVLLGYITRFPASLENKNFDWDQYRTLDQLKFSYRTRTTDSETDKLSLNALSVLCDTSASNNRLMDVKIRSIVCRVFDVFHPESDADFNHFHKLIFNLMQRAATPFLDCFLSSWPVELPPMADSNATLDSPVYKKPLIFRCIPYISVPAISDIMFAALVWRFPGDESDTKLQRNRYEELLKCEFFEEVLSIVFLNKDQDLHQKSIEATADFLRRWIEESCDLENSSILFKSLLGGPAIVNKFIECLNSPSCPVFQKSIIIELLHSICLRTQVMPVRLSTMNQMMADGGFPQPPKVSMSELITIAHAACNYCAPSLAMLCNYLKHSVELEKPDEIQFSSFKLKYKLGNERLQLMEIIFNVCNFAQSKDSLLETIPVIFWKITLDWFFEFPFNNSYHLVFFKLVTLVVKSCHKATLKQLLTRQRLIPRMIEAYTDQSKNSGSRGHILLLFNFLRLTAESLPVEDYLCQVLTSSEEWKEFQPTLLADTMRQINNLYPFSFDGKDQPKPHFAPMVMESLNPGGTPIESIDKRGTSIGSAYAYSLGFTTMSAQPDSGATPDTSIRKKKKKRRKSGNAGDVIGDVGQSSSAEEDAETSSTE